MRVLHLYAGNLYGGIEAMLATLARRRYAARRMEPHFALAFEGRLSRELRETGVPVEMLGAVRRSRPWTTLRAGWRLASLLRRGEFDVAVCHAAWSLATFGPAVARRGMPLVFWQHDAATGASPVERAARRRARPDLAICNSRFTQGTLPAIFPDVPSRVLYCPVPSPPRDAADARAAVRAELRTPADHVVIAQTSRMEEWKGQRLHLEALGRLRDVPGWTCWLAGGAQRPHEAGYVRRLRADAERLGIAGRVRFAGDRADIPRFLAAADVLCQPNLGPEPFGVSLVEALYAGLPVVTMAQGGATEVVDESCGILVPPGDVEGVADALHGLIADAGLLRALGAGGPPRARALSDPVDRIGELEEVLRDAAARRAA